MGSRRRSRTIRTPRWPPAWFRRRPPEPDSQGPSGCRRSSRHHGAGDGLIVGRGRRRSGHGGSAGKGSGPHTTAFGDRPRVSIGHAVRSGCTGFQRFPSLRPMLRTGHDGFGHPTRSGRRPGLPIRGVFFFRLPSRAEPVNMGAWITKRPVAPDCPMHARRCDSPYDLCRFPRSMTSTDVDALDWVVYGIPYDGGDVRPGPASVPVPSGRRPSTSSPTTSNWMSTSPLSHMADAGDAPVVRTPRRRPWRSGGIRRHAGQSRSDQAARRRRDHWIAHEHQGHLAAGSSRRRSAAPPSTPIRHRGWCGTRSGPTPHLHPGLENGRSIRKMPSVGIRGPLNTPATSTTERSRASASSPPANGDR